MLKHACVRVRAHRSMSDVAWCTGECFGKAGAYGIQGPASQFVRGIEGDFFNVMGFPVNEFSRRLGELIEAGTLVL